MPDEFYKLLLLDIPAPTISKTNIVASGSVDSISESLIVPAIPIISVPTTSISSGLLEQEYYYDIPDIPTISYGTVIVDVPAASGLLEYDVSEPVISYSAVAASGSVDNPEISLTPPIPIITCIPQVETLFDFAKVYSLKNNVYTDQTSAASSAATNDVNILPSGAALGDGIVMGTYHPNWYGATTILSTAGTGTYTVIWEYWAGSTWDSVTIVDNGIGNGDVLDWKATGYKRIRFSAPPLWDPVSITDVDGIVSDELYYIRCRIVAFTSCTVVPLAARIWGRSMPARLLNTRQTMNELIGEYYMTHLPMLTSIVFRSGNAFYWQFKMVDYMDYASARSYVVPRVSVSFQGRAFKAVTNPVTEINHGWYIVQIPAAYVQSQAILRATAPGAAQSDMTLDIEPITIGTAYNTWGDVALLTWADAATKTWFQILTTDL